MLFDFIPQKSSQQKKKNKKQLRITAKQFETDPIEPQKQQFNFDEQEDIKEIDKISKLVEAIQLDPIIIQDKEQPPQQQKSQTALTQLIDNDQQQQKELKFRNEDVSYLFTLLLNETKSKMKEMKDFYSDEKEYLQYLIPPFINETLAYVKSVAEDQLKKSHDSNYPAPLRFQVKINKSKTVLGKYLVLDAIEGDLDLETNYTWKNICITEYQEFQSARSFIVQVLVKQQNQHLSKKKHVGLLGIITRGDKNQNSQIYLPWSSRVINSLKIPNLLIESMNHQALKIQKELMKQYFPLTYPNFEELIPFEFLVSVNPIFSPATYLIELKAILSISRSKFFKCILKPQHFIEPYPVCKQAYAFGQPLKDMTGKYLKNKNIDQLFNNAQKQAIIHANDYTYPFTIINGPPGTGKTFTSLGIMSIVLDRMQELNENSIILACGHSNTVINDWVKKLTQGGLIDAEGKMKYCKVLRIGNADKCSEDIYDYCLEVVSQRQFFKKYLTEEEKNNVCQLIPSKRKYDQLTLIHIKQRISKLNEKIYDLKDFYYDMDYDEQSRIDKELFPMNLQKKELRRLYQTFIQILNFNKQYYKQLLRENLQNVQIIVSTLTSSSSSLLNHYLEDKYISMLIVDEAPMCFEPSVLIPLAKYPVYKLVLIGDHKQLGPVIYDTSNSTHFNYHISLYERIINATNKFIMLDIQYRSMPNLSIVTSHFFYDGKIIDGQNIQQMKFPEYLSKLLSNQKNFLFFDVKEGAQTFHTSNSYFNQYEAFGIVYLVNYLLQNYKLKDKPVSIITPYRAQVKFIKETIFRYHYQILDYVEVDTIDAFQGKENDIMIISLVRSEGLGFLTDYRRANVATSRAQYAQFIFGNSNALLYETNLWQPLYYHMISNGMIFSYNEPEVMYQQNYFQKVLSNSEQ